MCVADADHHASKFARNQPVSIPVLCEGLLLRQHEIESDSLPACNVKVLRPVPWEDFDGPDVRKVRSGHVLAHHPEAGVAPSGHKKPAGAAIYVGTKPARVYSLGAHSKEDRMP